MIYGYYRGLFATSRDRLFAVVGSALYEIFSDYSSLKRGTLNTHSGNVGISENESQLIIVDNVDGWIYTLATNALERIAVGGFVPGSHVININGVFVANRTNTGQFAWCSATRDGKLWDPLDYATAEGSPDNLVAIKKLNNEAWLFGAKTTEVWYDTGNATSRFQRVNGAFFDIGTSAKYSPAVLGTTVFWLGSDQRGQGIVWSATNYVPQRISTHAIEYIIGQMSDTTDAIGYCYQQEGHFFYVLTFPTGNRTLVYDQKTQMWHERGCIMPSGQNGRHRANCHAFCFGKNIVGDYECGKLYELDSDTFTDNSTPIKRIRTGPHVHNNGKKLFFSKFELDLERGTGLVSGQGENPKITLQYSDDGGMTFGNEIQMDIGKRGKYKTRAYKYRLGMSEDRVFRVTITDPVACTLIGAWADIETGGH
jgi:hypothetical protein